VPPRVSQPCRKAVDIIRRRFWLVLLAPLLALLLLAPSPTSGQSTVWSRQFGTSLFDRAWGVATDGAGHVYVVGVTSDALPGQSHSGGEDAFVRKHNSAGTELWTRQFSTSGRDTAARSIAYLHDDAWSMNSRANVTSDPS
jgi:hypothetical protein